MHAKRDLLLRKVHDGMLHFCLHPALRHSVRPGCRGCRGSAGGRRQRGVVRRVRKVEPLEVRPPAPTHLRIVRPGCVLLGAVESNSVINGLFLTPGNQGLTLVHVRAQLDQLQDTFMS
jgi:hypothetical protein